MINISKNLHQPNTRFPKIRPYITILGIKKYIIIICFQSGLIDEHRLFILGWTLIKRVPVQTNEYSSVYKLRNEALVNHEPSNRCFVALARQNVASSLREINISGLVFRERRPYTFIYVDACKQEIIGSDDKSNPVHAESFQLHITERVAAYVESARDAINLWHKFPRPRAKLGGIFDGPAMLFDLVTRTINFTRVFQERLNTV